MVSGILVFGDIRDAAAAIQKIAETRGEEGWIDLGLSAIGIVPGLGDYIKNAKYADEALQIAAVTFRNSDEVIAAYSTVSSNADQIIIGLRKNADELGAVFSRTIGEGFESTVTTGVRNGSEVEHIVVKDGDGLIRSQGGDPDIGSPANRGRIGEAMADQLARDRGWKILFSKDDPTGVGLDNVYETLTGELVVVEAKFIEGGRNIGLGDLRTNILDDNGNRQLQLSNDWIEGAIGRTPGLADETEIVTRIRQALEDGTLRKELVVVSNKHAGKTITEPLSKHPELGGNGTTPIRTTIVELPDGTVAKP